MKLLSAVPRMLGIVLPVCLFGLPGFIQGAPALLEQTDVFVAGQDGVFEYRIPGLITSNQGTLLAFCDARMRKQGDPPNDIDLVMKRPVPRTRGWAVPVFKAERYIGLRTPIHPADRSRGQVSMEFNQQNT